jgi:hypothetical protein
MIVVLTRKEHIKRVKVAKKKDQPVDLFWQKMCSKVPMSFSLTFSPFEISLLPSEEIPESSRFDRNNRKEDLIGSDRWMRLTDKALRKLGRHLEI